MHCDLSNKLASGDIASAASLRPPTSEDGAAVFELIRGCPPLDVNSRYCNLLQCSHFSDTCVLAEQEGRVVGFISAYRVPDRTDTLFVWQVAVGECARGQGLGGRMLDHLLARPACTGVRFVETTITEDNQPSWGLFSAFARRRATALERSLLFDQQRHFDGHHASEYRVRIGPFAASADALPDPAAAR